MSTAEAAILGQPVHIAGSSRPFGELTAFEVRARANELRGLAGFGPLARVAGVALAWGELGAALEHSGAGHVAELDMELLIALAPRLGVTLPV